MNSKGKLAAIYRSALDGINLVSPHTAIFYADLESMSEFQLRGLGIENVVFDEWPVVSKLGYDTRKDLPMKEKILKTIQEKVEDPNFIPLASATIGGILGLILGVVVVKTSVEEETNGQAQD